MTFINSWYDPPKAKEAAFAMIDRGADVMYAERFGVSDAARKERNVKVIGNVIDTSAQYPGTCWRARSGTWSRPSTAPSRRCSRAASRRPITASTATWRMAARALAMDEKLVPADVVKLVKEKEKEITDGLFRVNVNDAEPKSS